MISYDPLFRTMERKNITAYRLVKMGFSASTLQSIKHGNSMTMKTLNALCDLLDCSVSDIIEYRKDAPIRPGK
ncbi:MAG: helix-turn-helix transcriptional regulator [Lachnospiraceae bacterium]|nr:helix-turn-helix transcriptional regulator [Lachnospiraceae bacterium]